MYHSQKIGVFISHIFGAYQQGVCQGIIDKALEYGYTAEIFTSLDGENLGAYEIGEESILHIPNYDSFDGVIFASNTYISSDLKHKIQNKLQSLSCPIVEIAVADNQFPAVSLENSSMAGELTAHFLTVHHADRVCYLGCSEESFISDLRENYYREALKKHGKTPGEKDIYHCVYDAAAVNEALAFFLEAGTPQAVVCYNDRLALLFLAAVLAAGFRIPEDIAITGCDDTPEGHNTSPMLTTVSFPVYELGTCAVENLLTLIHGGDLPDTTLLSAKPLIHNSCGCSSSENANSVFFVRELSSRIEALESSILVSMSMSAALQHVSDLDCGMDLLEQFVQKIENCQEFYLCLYSDWDSVSSHILALTNTKETRTDTDTISLKFAFKNGKRLPECSYRKKNLLPDYIYNNSDCAYIYTPLFFEDKKFGYIALSYKDNQIDYHFRLVQWQININQMLQSIFEAKRTGMLVTRLEDIYMRDSLTGLYNKHGYNHMEEQILNRAVSDNLPLTAFLIDIDELKTINDTYGHSEGDFAIRVLGQALESTAEEDDLCARFSGDEFYMLTVGLSEKEAKLRIEAIESYLDNYNRLSGKEYRISCSCGFCTALPAPDFTPEHIQELFAKADQKMYEAKRKHHAAHT
ncbi:MAG: GGDEF domain-containing protein [Clostridium sp.]|nr:GGDEF domain-containing protein [Eubacterium sp.]MCM1181650.1 GGDEF domain-containing protein [Clostridium sp.]